MTSPAQCGFPSRGITFPKVSCNHFITNSAAFPLVPSPWSLLLHPLPFLRLSSFWLLVLFQLLLSIPEAGTFPKAPPSAHHGENFFNPTVSVAYGQNYSSQSRIQSCISFFFSFSFCLFLGLCSLHMEVPRLGLNWSYNCQPAPQSQQRGI